MPITRNDADMPKWGWVKEILYEKIMCNDTTQGRPILTELDFYASAQRCGNCRSNEFVWIQVPSHDYMGGVLMSCSRCGMTTGPLGERYASNRRQNEISVERALEICKRTGHIVPVMLKDALRALESEKARAAKGQSRRPRRIGE